MRRTPRGIGTLAAALVLAACATPAASPTVTPTAGGTVGVNLTRLVDVEIVQRSEAAIEIAFDAAAAESLVTPLPADADFAATAVLCLFIGERDTGGWAVALQSIRMVDGQMRILARETAPRGTPPAGPSYAADCAMIDRSVLPIGPLPVTSTDTTSDEFIVDGVVEVPAATGTP